MPTSELASLTCSVLPILPEELIHRLFEAQAARTPEATALRRQDETLSYAELNARANQLARHLRTLGVGPDRLVGVCLDSSPAMVVALLGILKAGGAYLPLDPDYPADRLAFLMQDAQVSLLLTKQSLRERLPASHVHTLCLDTEGEKVARHDETDLEGGAGPDDLAYVIYTSGSTGAPKGVMIAHRGVAANLHWRQETFPLTPEDRLLQTYSFSFDPSVWAFFWPLSVGATLVLPRPGGIADMGYLAEVMAEYEISVVGFGPAVWRVLLSEPALTRCRTLRHAFSGGEALTGDLRRRFFDRFPDALLHNVYGPTEATIDATWWTCPRPDSSDASTPIGYPLPTADAWIVDEEGQPAPDGAEGELLIGGIGLAQGYLHRPELTAEKFIAPSCGVLPGTRLYRTGDKARRRPDGAIEYLGRMDDQVKVRGYRIELGEIESVLAAQPGVRAAAVTAREDRSGDKHLAAYIVPDSEESELLPRLRRALREALPGYMAPSAWMLLESLPLSPNGKIDRRALPAPQRVDWERVTDSAPPQDTRHQQLVRIWEELLDIRPIGIHDNFFEMGGHSLTAARLIARLRRLWGCEIPLRSLFEAPTVALFAERLPVMEGEQPETPHTAIAPVPRTETMPLSSAQEALWFVNHLQPDSAAYNIPLCFHFSGSLDIDALKRSLFEIVRRHEVLRTCYTRAADGQPVQTILQPETTILEEIDLRDVPVDAREARARQAAQKEARLPFALAEDRMLRAALIRLNHEEYRLLLTLHHIACDGWSVGILIHELTRLYAAFAAGQPSPLPELPLQYADYAVWQRRREGSWEETQLAYWTQKLADTTPLLLPTDRPRPLRERFAGARLPITLPRSLAEKLHDLSRQEEVTFFMTLTAAFQGLLARYTGQEDIIIGSPTAGRPRVETEPLIGYFINPLALRTNLGGNPSAREMLRRVRDVTLDAYAHQDLPFERVVRALQPERDAGRHPLFSVMLILQNTPVPSHGVAGLTVKMTETETGAAKMDLLLSLWDGPDGVSGWWEYNTDLYDRATIERLSSHFQNLLEGIVADPSQELSALPLLSETERRQILTTSQRRDTPIPTSQTVHALVEDQAARRPDVVALEWHDRKITYGELNDRANQLAHALQDWGVRPGDRVAICLERSPNLFVALLGILKSGAAYLPIDPDYPAERIAFMLEDAQPSLLLTQSSLGGVLPRNVEGVISLDQEEKSLALRSKSNLVGAADADSLAYVMYTSGSTGRPKGVLIPHRGIVRLVQKVDYVDITPDDVFLQLAPVSFDASTFEIWGCLANGARLALFPARTPSLEELGQALNRYGVTILWLTAGLFSLMVDERLDDLRPLRQLLAGGDVLPPAQVRKALNGLPHCRLINGYGPTESTTFTCCHTVTADSLHNGSVPIGHPINHTEVYVLDAYRDLAPIGVSGELYIGGDGLAQGYLNQPDLTAEKFVSDPFSPDPAKRLYRSGDLGRRRVDGTLDFLGRQDTQVKVHGFRIELSEIETALTRNPGIREAIVLAEGAGAGKQLAAYLVPEPGHTLSPPELRRSLQETVPGYMIPHRFVLLDTLPLTPNGKVDRSALRDLLPASETTSGYVPPRTPLETALCGLWAEVLSVAQVGIRDNFFEIGGHSLRAVLLLHRIERLYGRKLPLATLFAHATVEDLARILWKAESKSQSSLIAIHAGGARRPFFFLHGDFQGGFYCLNIARHLGPDQPLYALPPHGMDGGAVPATIEKMAEEYVQIIRDVQREGPYQLGGFCNGGLVAYEIARQLRRQGQEIKLLLLLDTLGMNTTFKRSLHRLAQALMRIAHISPIRRQQLFIRLQECLMPLGMTLKRLHDLITHTNDKVGHHFFPERMAKKNAVMPLVEQETRVATPHAYYRIIGQYILRPYDGPITLLWAEEEWGRQSQELIRGWQDVAPRAQVTLVPGGHLTCLTDYVAGLTETIARNLEATAE